MKNAINLSKDNFEIIDFTEAKIIDFSPNQILPNDFSFKIWGATLLVSPMWNFQNKFSENIISKEDMYVFGEGTIKIENLVGGNIEIFIYESAKSENKIINVAKNYDGSDLAIRRSWEYDGTKIYDGYLWECVTNWPYGFCNLNLLSNNGNVHFEFDDINLIPVSEYSKNPSKYAPAYK